MLIFECKSILSFESFLVGSKISLLYSIIISSFESGKVSNRSVNCRSWLLIFVLLNPLQLNEESNYKSIYDEWANTSLSPVAYYSDDIIELQFLD